MSKAASIAPLLKPQLKIGTSNPQAWHDVFADNKKYNRFSELVRSHQHAVDAVAQYKENCRLALVQDELNRIRKAGRGWNAEFTALQQEREFKEGRVRDMVRRGSREFAAIMQDCERIEYICQLESIHLWQLDSMTQGGASVDAQEWEIRAFENDVGRLSVDFPKSPKTSWPWPLEWAEGWTNLSQQTTAANSIPSSREQSPCSEPTGRLSRSERMQKEQLVAECVRKLREDPDSDVFALMLQCWQLLYNLERGTDPVQNEVYPGVSRYLQYAETVMDYCRKEMYLSNPLISHVRRVRPHLADFEGTVW